MGTYLDFDLLIHRDGGEYRARVLNAPIGQASAPFSPPFSDQETTDFPLRFGDWERSDSPRIQAIQVFGERLFRAAFAEEVRDCLRSSLTYAADHKAGLRIRLRLNEVPELADLPWEYLWDPRHKQFLMLGNIAPIVIVRYIEVPEIIQPLKVRPPLRILAITSSPVGLQPLNIEKEWKLLASSLDDLAQRGFIFLERLERPTLGELRRKMRKKDYHILHFMGHGLFDKSDQNGFLALEDENRRPRWVSGQDLAIQLNDLKSLRLTILNSCEGARASRTDSFVGVAQSLVQRGAPAVIAMQFEISDQAAVVFSHSFYQALAEINSIDAALTEGRLAIHADGNKLEWGVPVLYLRAPDSQIFEITEIERESLSFRPEPIALPSDILPSAYRGDSNAAEIKDDLIPVTEQALQRTPHMEISASSVTEATEDFKVSVYMDSAYLSIGTTSSPQWSLEQERFEIDVWLVVPDSFEIEGVPVKRLVISRNEEISTSVDFRVARKSTVKTQNSLFSALFSYRGRPCGLVTRVVPLTTAPSEVPKLLIQPPSIQIEAGAAPPDLSIRIVASGTGQHTFDCLVQTPLIPDYRDGKIEPWQLSSPASDFVQRKMALFTSKTVTPFGRTSALRGAGLQFFEASPSLFRKVFWELIDKNIPLRTISIVTEEPNIPWELMIPSRVLANGELEERAPIGTDFLISRWTSRSVILPLQRVPLFREAYIIAPRDSRLLSTEEEAQMFLTKLSGKRIDPATIENLDRSLSEHRATLLHFTCHAKRGEADRPILILERQEELELSMLRALPGMQRAFRSKPLVFLNASEAGRQTTSLFSGFPETFIAMGASGVIAPLWAVKDSIAHKVAIEFYERTRREPNTPFSEILRDIRKKSYDVGGGEDSYAAYIFYGDPLAARTDR